MIIGALAALSGAIAVMAGARGAHGAVGEAAEWLRTGSHYQMVHAVAALVVMGMPGGRWPAALFVAGGRRAVLGVALRDGLRGAGEGDLVRHALGWAGADRRLALARSRNVPPLN